jgi:hypothetical protein
MMKLPNWFKISWWILLTSIVTSYLYKRYPQLVQGNAVPADIFIFFVWVALALVPIFQEISFFGITLKQEIKRLRQEFGVQISSLRTEVQNSVNVRTQINPQFTFPPPLPDSQLPQLEARVQAAVGAALQAHGVGPQADAAPEALVDDNTLFLFQARLNIERELRRISNDRLQETERQRHVPIMQITRFLVNSELIEPSLVDAIREVYSVCSPAIHGEVPTQAQVSFVREVLPRLLAALRAIR